MELLYLLIICCSTTLTTVYTYVLLAANLDDFRSIAKKFVPETVADQIVDLASESGYRNRQSGRDDDTEYTDDSQQSQQDRPISFEMTTEIFKRPPQQPPPQSRYELKSVPPVITLDEIVERVKQRLQVELLNRSNAAKAQAAQANAQNPIVAVPVNNVIPKKTMALTAANIPVYNNPVNAVNQEVQYQADYVEPQKPKLVAQPIHYQGQMLSNQPQLQNKRLVDRSKSLLPMKQRGYVINPKQEDTKYVQQVLVPTVQQPLMQQQPLIQQQSIRQPVVMQPVMQQQPVLQQQQPTVLQQNKMRVPQKRLKKQRVTPQTVAQTMQTTEITVEVLSQDGGGIFETVDMRKANDSYEDYVTPPKEEAFESEVEETTTFKPVVIKLKNKPKNRAPSITPELPVVEPVPPANIVPLAEDETKDDEEYEEEVVETTTEPKAKTESISDDEKELKPDTNNTITADGKGKITKKVKMGTMIPTREFYKLSSPNYYAKLPTIAEKYNFNEPIPEADREPENLKPIGNPPASINGKVMLL